MRCIYKDTNLSLPWQHSIIKTYIRDLLFSMTGCLHGCSLTQCSTLCVHGRGWREDHPVFLHRTSSTAGVPAPQCLVAHSSITHGPRPLEIRCSKRSKALTVCGTNQLPPCHAVRLLSNHKTGGHKFPPDSGSTSEYPCPCPVVSAGWMCPVPGTPPKEAGPHRPSGVWLRLPREHDTGVCSLQSDSRDDWTGDRCTGIDM